MSDKKSTESRIGKIQWALFAVTFLSLIIAFTGVNFQNISSYFSESMFPKADFEVESWTTPTILPSDFRESLSVSPEYFMVTSIRLKSDKPYQGEPMRLRISFDNKGKKSVEQPRIVTYFVDYTSRVWNIWNKSITNDMITKGCRIDYYFPPLDEKIVGTWSIFALLYDDAEGVLVSYVLRAFTVTDVAPIPWWQEPTTLILFFYFASIIVLSILMWRSKKFRRIMTLSVRKRKEKESDSKDSQTQ